MPLPVDGAAWFFNANLGFAGVVSLLKIELNKLNYLSCFVCSFELRAMINRNRARLLRVHSVIRGRVDSCPAEMPVPCNASP